MKKKGYVNKEDINTHLRGEFDEEIQEITDEEAGDSLKAGFKLFHSILCQEKGSRNANMSAQLFVFFEAGQGGAVPDKLVLARMNLIDIWFSRH